jgi:hypothetical protein
MLPHLVGSGEAVADVLHTLSIERCRHLPSLHTHVIHIVFR